ncbi:phosphohistidine phosphatase SixA [Archaeoglobus sp.]
MRLYLMQHGKAKPKEVDPERSLTEEGAKEVEKVAEFLERAGVKVERIYHSGKKRAEQTAEIVGKHLKVKVEKADGLEPLADIGVWAEKLEKLDEDIMLVGHLPHLSKLTNYLLTGNPDLDAVAFIFGGVVCLEREERKWRLLWAVRPEILV